MKRLRVILLFLLLGAVVNVAVAWGIALWGDSALRMTGPSPHGFTNRFNNRLFPTPFDDSANSWVLIRSEKPGILLVVVTTERSSNLDNEPIQFLLPPVAALHQQLLAFESSFPSDAKWSDMPGFFYWDGRGWPMISLACYWPWFNNGNNPSIWPEPPIVGGIDFGSPTSSTLWLYGVYELRGFPYLPVWPGFIFNTLFFAVILWLLINVPLALRRMVRSKRGFCVKCAYDLRGVEHEACPECGLEVPIQ